LRCDFLRFSITSTRQRYKPCLADFLSSNVYETIKSIKACHLKLRFFIHMFTHFYVHSGQIIHLLVTFCDVLI
jgi:hypothetical protein